MTNLFRAMHGESDEFASSRVRWLIGLRWGAIAMIATAAFFSWLGFFPGLNRGVLVATAIVAGGYNLMLSLRGEHSNRDGVTHAVVDMLILTIVLWASGGIHTPFLANYIFHVAIVGILGGQRGTVIAAVIAVLGCFALLLTDHIPGLKIATWNPVPPWDAMSDLSAFVGVTIVVAYLVSQAIRELKEREVALARIGETVALEYEVLSNTLSELDAGLEVVDRDGTVMWRNKRAAELSPWAPTGGAWTCPGSHRPCQGQVAGVCPIKQSLENAEPGRCRFAANIDGSERVYEMLVFPLAGSPPRGGPQRAMNLYLDRTSTVLDERRFILAERLASLGRVTQGVAHELNTPLATIRTLAADMQKALQQMRETEDHEARHRLIADVEESAEIVRDETRRLGRITQGLLTGGDVVRQEIEHEVRLGVVLERARALVFAGMRDAPPLEIDRSVDTLSVVADRDRLVQVLVNLLQNACDAVREYPSGGLHVSARYHEDEGRVSLLVEDDGTGLAPEIKDRLFEPFSTTKPPGKGTGLGLYTTYMLVRGMRGSIHLEDRDEGGTRARVVLPAAAEGAIRAEPVASNSKRQLPVHSRELQSPSADTTTNQPARLASARSHSSQSSSPQSHSQSQSRQGSSPQSHSQSQSPQSHSRSQSPQSPDLMLRGRESPATMAQTGSGATIAERRHE